MLTSASLLRPLVSLSISVAQALFPLFFSPSMVSLAVRLTSVVHGWEIRMGTPCRGSADRCTPYHDVRRPLPLVFYAVSTDLHAWASHTVPFSSKNTLLVSPCDFLHTSPEKASVICCVGTSEYLTAILGRGQRQMRTAYSRLSLAWCSVGCCSGDPPHTCCFSSHPVWNKCAAWILGKSVLPTLPGFEIDMPARVIVLFRLQRTGLLFVRRLLSNMNMANLEPDFQCFEQKKTDRRRLVPPLPHDPPGRHAAPRPPAPPTASRGRPRCTARRCHRRRATTAAAATAAQTLPRRATPPPHARPLVAGAPATRRRGHCRAPPAQRPPAGPSL